MKHSLLAMVALLFCLITFAQSDSDQAPYLRYPTVPPFNLLKTDSTMLTKNDLHKNRQTLVMFFSPDCPHCQHQTEDLLADFSSFKNTDIVMATYQPFEEMVAFKAKYKLAEHPNIMIGRDEKFFLVPYYRMHNLPFLALYDRRGKLITTFEGNQKVSKILNAFQGKKSAPEDSTASE